MSDHSARRIWKPEDKLRIVLETMSGEARPAEICRREGLSPTLVYPWRKALMKSAGAIFARKRPGPNGEDPRLQKLEAENTRMKGVIAESEGDQGGSPNAENLDLKKTLSD